MFCVFVFKTSLAKWHAVKQNYPLPITQAKNYCVCQVKTYFFNHQTKYMILKYCHQITTKSIIK